MKTLYDIESGQPFEVTEKQYRQIIQFKQKMLSIINDGKPVGRVFITGTAEHRGVTSEAIKKMWLKCLFKNTKKYFT